ncbi:MAG: sulfite exporter TauE/SafE family protein [Bacteroidetes bacterium]|nr:MAG: sulfite exporter TauE/SafE family protein [Bacteroidota bacterium]
MTWIEITELVLLGIFVGFVNTLSGSGSLLTLPFLISLGLPANVANGTNRIAILLQNVVGVASFKKQKVFEFKEAVWLTIPAIIGAVIGASVAVKISDALMEKIIAGILVFMFLLLIFKPNMWLREQAKDLKTKPTFIQFIVLFFVGIYGGFIQAGVGLFLLAGLVLGAGFDLVKANAVKGFIILLYTVFALSIFIYNDSVDYKIGLILAGGNMAGAFIASRFAVDWGPKFVRYVLLVVLFLASLKLFGVFDYLFS